MRPRFLLALLALLVCFGGGPARDEPTPVPGVARDAGAAFVPNLGQWPDSVRFGVCTASATVALEDRGWTLGLHESPTALGVRMSFEGAAPSPDLEAEGLMPGHHNYFYGSDPSRWRTGVPLYSAVRYGGLYPGIDLRMRVAHGHPEYDLLLAPGSDLAGVCVRVEGAEGLHVQDDGSLVLETALGPVLQPVPHTWQSGAAGERREVTCRYVLRGRDRFGYEVEGWDTDLALTIDPGLIWQRSLGTTVQHAVSIDGGVVTAAGTAQSLVTTVGAYGVTIGGFYDAFVSRVVPGSGTAQLLYSTYLGGSGALNTSGDEASDVFVDAAGVVTVVGWTNSTDFPTTPGAYSRTFAGGVTDAFVARLDPSRTGAAQLVYSTLLGGQGGNGNWDERCQALSVDSNGVVTVGGSTSAADFPTTANAFSRTFQSHGGTWDGFVSRLDPSQQGSAQLVYSTLFGGWSQYVNTGDHVLDLHCDASGVITFCGQTESSTGFPTTPNAYSTTPWNTSFLARLDPSRAGSAQLLYSTFFGFGGAAEALSVDANGIVTLAGYGYVPTTPGAYDRTANGGNDAYASQFDLSKPGPAQLIYSTLLGGSAGGEGDKARDVAVDGPLITLVGRTNSPDFPTTPGAYDPTRNPPGHDGFLSRLDLTLTGSAQLVYSTFVDFQRETWAVATGVAGRAVVGGRGDLGDLELAPYLGGPGSQDPDIAYDRNTELYLVAWAEGGGNGPAFGSLVDKQTTISELSIPLGSGREPSVANVRGRGLFAVGTVEQDGQSVAFRSVGPAGGAVSAPAVLQLSGPGQWSRLGLAGDVTSTGDTALAVWEHFDPGTGVSTVLGSRATVSSNGAVSASPPQVLRAGASRPALSRTGGAPGRYLLVWTEAGQLMANVIDASFNVLAQVVVAAAPGSPDPRTGVDGDGTSWVVAYEQPRSSGTGFDLRSRRVSYAPTSGRAVLGPEAVVSEAGTAPSVAFVGGSQWVVYHVPSAARTQVASIDPHGCTACEGTLSLGFAGVPGAAVGSQRTGYAAAGDQGLVAWAEGAAGQTRLKLRPLVADDGAVTNLGGGCGAGGEALATCAITGHAGFVHGLQGAAPSASALLVISTRTAGVPCGPCRVVPDPAFGVTVPARTDADGAATVAMPIPPLSSLVGTKLIDQWFVLAPGGCFLGLSFSDAIEIEIE